MTEREAFKRGVEAMREAAVAILNEEIEAYGRGGNATVLCMRLREYIQSAPIPEDKR
jgi:DNA-binding SARP family transcriptional activator